MVALPTEPQPDPDDGVTPSLAEPIDLAALGAARGPMRDTLLPDERVEFDRLLQVLPPSETALVGIIEIFMRHGLNQAAMFNAEVRDLLAAQGRRLAAIEAATNPAVIVGMHSEMAAQTEAISIVGENLVRLVADVRGLLDHGARAATELASHDRRLRALESGRGRERTPFGGFNGD